MNWDSTLQDMDLRTSQREQTETSPSLAGDAGLTANDVIKGEFTVTHKPSAKMLTLFLAKYPEIYSSLNTTERTLIDELGYWDKEHECISDIGQQLIDLEFLGIEHKKPESA